MNKLKTQQKRYRMKSIDILVIVNNEFTNYFLHGVKDNLEEVIDYTEKDGKFKVRKVKYVISNKDKDKYFNLQTSTKFTTELKYTDSIKITEIFNDLRETVADYVAFYGADTVWYKDHLVESITNIELDRKKWSVAVKELMMPLGLTKNEVQTYIFPNKFNPLINDVTIGELVVSGKELKNVDFNRAKVTDSGIEYFYPGYAMVNALGEYSETKHCTVKYFYRQPKQIRNDYIDFASFKDTNKPENIKISVIVNASTQNGMVLSRIVESLNNQKYPKENFEVIFVGNYQSGLLFTAEGQLKKELKNVKVVFIPNNTVGHDNSLFSQVYFAGLQKAEGQIITYYDSDEGLYYTPAYLSKLVEVYENKNIKWTLANYYDIINGQMRHSDIVAPSREDLHLTLFSHTKDNEVMFMNFKTVDKHFTNNNIFLVNTLNMFQSQLKEGKILEQAVILKG